MTKTICIKSNNTKVNKYIIDELNNFKLNTIFLSVHQFSLYTNIIIHYKGTETIKFTNKISNLLTKVIINFYTKHLMKNLIDTNYFYFTDFDKLKILDYCVENCNEINFSKKRKALLKKLFNNYFANNKKIILEGFINFSIKDYIKLLDEIVDQSVNNYLIEKEYIEFINLLRCYVNSQPPIADKVYLMYNNETSKLLDENGNNILIDNNIKNKYLSDINFSENDYCLNTLLTLLPKELVIENQEAKKDEFLTTLELIFEDRICKT